MHRPRAAAKDAPTAMIMRSGSTNRPSEVMAATPRRAPIATCWRWGSLDPAKVTRLALQNASSIASLLLTTDCMVANAPKKPGGDARPGLDSGMSVF